MIPNARFLDDLTEKEANDLFSGDPAFIIPLIPDAYRFTDKDEFRDMMSHIRTILRQA
jgi:hypothetical protein